MLPLFWPRLVPFVLCLAAACSAPQRQHPTTLFEDGPPHVVGSKLLQIEEIAADGAFEPATPEAGGSLDRFRKEVIGRLGEASADPHRLLRAAMAAHAGKPDAENARIVLELHPAPLGPVWQLEADLLARQMARLDMVRQPSEILAAVFRSRDGRRLRLVTYTVNDAGIGNIGRFRPHLDAALAEVDASGARRWTFFALFHNHDFFFDGRADVGGAVCPSSADAQLFQAWAEELGLQAAWITNGLVSARYPAAMFGQFRTASPGP